VSLCGTETNLILSLRYLTLMGDDGNLREDLKLPDGDLGPQVYLLTIIKFKLIY